MNDNTLYVRKNGGEITIENFSGIHRTYQAIMETTSDGRKIRRSPVVDTIEYDAEKHVFYLEDHISTASNYDGAYSPQTKELHHVNIYFNMNEDFRFVGEVYNDYFDSIGGIDKVEEGKEILAYEVYQDKLICEVLIDKEKEKQDIKRIKKNSS